MNGMTKSVSISSELAESLLGGLQGVLTLQSIYPPKDEEELLLRGREGYVQLWGFEGKSGPTFLRIDKTWDVARLGGGRLEYRSVFMAVPEGEEA